MTNEKFNEIYSDMELRNQVAYAHGHYDQSGRFKYKATCSYPVKWIVTDEQIEIANKEVERCRKEIFDKHYNDLLFCGMGMTFPESDVTNYRIRTEFLNKEGQQFFVEFSTGRRPTDMCCDYSIDRSKQKDRNDEQAGYNYGSLQRRDLPEYTKKNILDLVNSTFKCAFKNIVIDNYTINPNNREIICASPKE